MKEYFNKIIEINIRNRKNLFLKWVFVPILYAVAYYISWKVDCSCIWKALSGVSCPGCGFTRSLIAAFSLKFEDAWNYHPMFWSAPVLGFYYLMNGSVFKNRIVNGIAFGIVAVGFLIVWIYRLAFGIVI